MMEMMILNNVVSRWLRGIPNAIAIIIIVILIGIGFFLFRFLLENKIGVVIIMMIIFYFVIFPYMIGGNR